MVSEKIKELRKQAKLSQEALAEKLNVSRQAVTKWETGAGLPDIDNLIAISELFNLSIDDLVGTNKVNSVVEKEYIYESVTEYDIDCQKDFDITFMGADTVGLHGYEGEKVKVCLFSNTISDIQKVFKTKIDDVKKRIDIDVKRMEAVSETEAKAGLIIDIAIPSEYVGKIEIEGNTNQFNVSELKNENVEFSGKVKKVLIDNDEGHIELNTDEDTEVFVKNMKGNVDINQISATSRISIYEGNDFAIISKGVLNKIIADDNLTGKKELSEDPELVIELNGMKSELTVSSFS